MNTFMCLINKQILYELKNNSKVSENSFKIWWPHTCSLYKKRLKFSPTPLAHILCRLSLLVTPPTCIPNPGPAAKSWVPIWVEIFTAWFQVTPSSVLLIKCAVGVHFLSVKWPHVWYVMKTVPVILSVTMAPRFNPSLTWGPSFSRNCWGSQYLPVENITRI